MHLVAIKIIRVRLNDTAIVQEQETGFFGGHAGNKRFGIVKGGT
jgi:hypothetical protein